MGTPRSVHYTFELWACIFWFWSLQFAPETTKVNDERFYPTNHSPNDGLENTPTLFLESIVYCKFMSATSKRKDKNLFDVNWIEKSLNEILVETRIHVIDGQKHGYETVDRCFWNEVKSVTLETIIVEMGKKALHLVERKPFLKKKGVETGKKLTEGEYAGPMVPIKFHNTSEYCGDAVSYDHIEKVQEVFHSWKNPVSSRTGKMVGRRSAVLTFGNYLYAHTPYEYFIHTFQLIHPAALCRSRRKEHRTFFYWESKLPMKYLAFWKLWVSWPNEASAIEKTIETLSHVLQRGLFPALVTSYHEIDTKQFSRTFSSVRITKKALYLRCSQSSVLKLDFIRDNNTQWKRLDSPLDKNCVDKSTTSWYRGSDYWIDFGPPRCVGVGCKLKTDVK